MSSNPVPTARELPDQSVRLMVTGILEILLGCLCLLLVALMGGTFAAQAKQPAGHVAGLTASTLVQSLLIYGLGGIAFLWVGLGLASARRWAWALTVVWSWIWLVVGTVAFLMVLGFMGQGTWDALADQGKLPPEMATAVKIITMVILAGIYFVVPGVFLALCNQKSVRATCERRDPKIRWTDRCPLPVLALSLLFGLTVLSMFSMATYRWTFPVFGVIVSGAAGAALVLLIDVVMAWLAWGTYRLQPTAWWGAVVVSIVLTANMVVVFAATDFVEMYKAMGLPAEQIEIFKKSGLVAAEIRWGPVLGVVGGLAWLGYLLFLRRYFFRAKVATPESVLGSGS